MIRILVVITQLSLIAPPLREPAPASASASASAAEPAHAAEPPPEPAPAAEPAPVAEPLSQAAPDSEKYRRLTDLLAQGVIAGDENPEEAVNLIEVALTQLAEFAPQLAADPDALALRASAHVSLARAYLLAGDAAKAAAAMDEGIRSAQGQPLPVDLYGPTVERLWLERSSYVKRHPGQIVVVKCSVECRVYINERRVGPAELRKLSVGTYRLWIDPADGSSQRLRKEIEVGQGKTPLTVRFPPPETSDGMTPSHSDMVWRPTVSTKKSFKQSRQAVARRGKATMIAGGVMMGLGAVSFIVSGVTPKKSWAPIVAGIVGGVVEINGIITLIVGGRSYSDAKGGFYTHLQLTPSFTASREGGSLGVSLRF